uniref:Si:ch211-261d9.1 n=1 Tax=Paramormyrops kingsleyae TaxID=1676925 RepID=A0A3B3QKC6_9TELE
QAFETATRHLSHMDRSVVADYLSPSTSTKSGNVIRARMLLSLIAGESSGSGEPAPRTSGAECPQMDERAAYDLFIKSFPVAINGRCPGKLVRTELVGIAYERLCYDHWRSDQKTLRMKHVIHFGRRLPTEHRVHAWMEKEGWTSNCPDVQQILRQWRPSGSVDTAVDCSVIKKLLQYQRWMGLIIVEIEGKGRGVKTTRKF